MTKKQRIIYWLGVALVILIAVIFLAKIVAAPNITPDKITDQDWTRGNKDSKVILIEYSDFQCPACQFYYKMVDDLVNEFGNHIYFAYRNYPLKQHPNAVPAAQAAEAAGVQGKFWEMSDLLFANQKEITALQNPKDKFVEYANNLGLNKDQFLKDYDSSKTKDSIIASGKNADKLKLRGTPSFFLNGKLINNPRDYESFRQLIRDELAKNP